MIDLSQGLQPNSFLGITLICIGTLFSAGCIYIMSNHDQDSIEDKRRKAFIAKERKEKIASLYPKKI